MAWVPDDVWNANCDSGVHVEPPTQDPFDRNLHGYKPRPSGRLSFVKITLDTF